MLLFLLILPLYLLMNNCMQERVEVKEDLGDFVGYTQEKEVVARPKVTEDYSQVAVRCMQLYDQLATSTLSTSSYGSTPLRRSYWLTIGTNGGEAFVYEIDQGLSICM